MWKYAILLAILAYSANWLYKYCRFTGYHRVAYNHYPGPCKYVPNIENGAEDMEWLPNGKIIMTTGLRFFPGNPNFLDVQSSFKLFDFNEPKEGAQPVTVKDFPGMEDSDLHGLSVYSDPQTGAILVYVVNHSPEGSVVELFTYNEQENVLYHKGTVGRGDKNFGKLNDVVIVGPRKFYVTNTFYSSTWELTLQLNWSPVVFWDGKTSHVASDRRILLGNGITKSLDGKYIFVADSFVGQILVYLRRDDNSLELTQTYALHMVPDNLVVDPETGDIWVGAHLSGGKSLAVFEDPKNNISPSKVIRVRFEEGSLTEMTEVFSDDGRFFSGSSVAIHSKDQLLIGSVLGKGLLCDVKYLTS